MRVTRSADPRGGLRHPATVALSGCAARTSTGPGTQTPKTATAARAGATPQPADSNQPAQPGQVQGPPPLGAGKVGSLAAVPWAEIGAGWAVAEFTTGSSQAAGPATLYLIDPDGGRYQLHSWPATTRPWVLLAWSGDKGRVLLQEPGTSQPTLHQLTLATGQITTFTLPPTVTTVLGYTRPDGENILVQQDGIVRYSLTGALQARLSAGPEDATAVSSLDGLTEVVSAGTGVEVVGNAGGEVRFVPVPGTDPAMGGCTPERWWNTADVLVACTPTGAIGPQLWLVPVGGATPTALTPVRTSGPDFGDVDAWQLPTGLYLQAEPGCGPPFIARQPADGTAPVVAVPGGSASIVIATSDDQMLVQQFHECVTGSSLAWFNPATSAARAVLTAPANSTGVITAIPYDGDGEQPPTF
jgi:hypothetical protein